MWPRILSRLLKKSLIESFTFCAARDQLSQFENERLSKLFFALEVSNIFLRYMKEYFQLYKRSFSFFRSKEKDSDFFAFDYDGLREIKNQSFWTKNFQLYILHREF